MDLFAYASLDIDQSHTECSEAFYRKELETDIRTTPSKTGEERRKMLELLKNFEESARDDELDILGNGGEDADEGDTLESRLGALDLGILVFQHQVQVTQSSVIHRQRII